MCGRAKLTVPFAVLAKLYRLEEVEAPALFPRLSIAPTDPIAIVRAVRGGTRRLALVRWGLIPSWKKGLRGGPPLFNARSESIATKPAFRAAFRKSRCLVLADAFYEWKTEGKAKTPHIVTVDEGAPFAMAGLWTSSTTENGEVVESCTVLTREAAGEVAAIHPRMPVILAPESHDAWLDPAVTDPTVVEALVAAALTDALHVAVLTAVPPRIANDASAKKQLELFG